MGNRPKQERNEAQQPASPQRPPTYPPQQRDDKGKSDHTPQRKPERSLGDDPDAEGQDNSSLPEGSGGTQENTTPRPRRTVLKKPNAAATQADAQQPSDRRGDGSAAHSNVRNETARGAGTGKDNGKAGKGHDKQR